MHGHVQSVLVTLRLSGHARAEFQHQADGSQGDAGLHGVALGAGDEQAEDLEVGHQQDDDPQPEGEGDSQPNSSSYITKT